MRPLKRRGELKQLFSETTDNKTANWRGLPPSSEPQPHVNVSCGFDSSARLLWLLSAWIRFPRQSLARGLSPPPEVLSVKCQSKQKKRGLKFRRRVLVWFVRRR